MTQLLYTEPLLFQAGDRLSREEFLERWERMPELKFAELIDGVVYMPSPLSVPHGEKDALLQGWAVYYAGRSHVAKAVTQATWLMLKSAPQPDLALRLLPEYGGQTGLEGKLGSGAPELIVEVALASRSYDLGAKLELYERAGVREYLAALVEEERLEWRILRSGRYELNSPDAFGTYRSEVLPGLWLNEPAYWRQDFEQMLAVLEEGLRSPELRAFLSRHGR